MALTLELRGTPELLTTLDGLGEIVDGDVLFRVWSAGANQGKGDYERYVMSARWQAWMHRGRWLTDEKVAERHQQDVVDLVNVAVDVVLAGGRAWRPYIQQAMQLIKRTFQDYPAQRPGQTYQRTYTLRGSWREELLV